MITAAEARELRPRSNLIEQVKFDIDRAIRNVGVAGRQDAEVTALIPQFSSWATSLAKLEDGEPSARPEYDQLLVELKEAGFKVDMHPGGGAKGRPFIRLSWAA